MPEDTRTPIRGYMDGCFDLLHAGHCNAIRQAKALCDVLIVGIHSDAEIAHHKGPPVVPERERYALLAHLKWIDGIVWDAPFVPTLALLERPDVRADFAIHADDMTVDADGRSCYDELRRVDRLRIVRRTEGVSSTDLVGRLLRRIAPIGTVPAGAAASAVVPLLASTRRIAEFSPRRAPTPEDRVVYVEGTFDLFHVGHADTLAQARALGTFLLVGVWGDEETATDDHRPFMGLHERVLGVCACKHVDEVLIGAPRQPTEAFLRLWNVHIVAEGGNGVPRSGGAGHVRPVHRLPSAWPDLGRGSILRRVAEHRDAYAGKYARKSRSEAEYEAHREHLREG